MAMINGVLLIVSIAIAALCHGEFVPPTNEYEFALERDRLVELENEFQNNKYVLSEVINMQHLTMIN